MPTPPRPREGPLPPLPYRPSTAAVLFLITACSHSPRQTPVPDRGDELRTALALVDSALVLMRAYSINTSVVDWTGVRTTAHERLLRSRQPPGDAARLAIRYALSALGDHHSFLMFAGATPRWAQLGAPASDPQIRFLAPRFGYATVPAFHGGADDSGASYAAHYHQQLTAVTEAGACAWVVDLRGNVGGNMWPMLLGIGPVLGDGLAGGFVIRDSVIPWGYTQGVVWYGSDTLGQVLTPFSLPWLPSVAILTGPLTASSGEAIAIAFRGRSRARSFGSGTGGLSTGNQGFTLADGSKLVLTTAIDADRTGRRYGDRVEPDEAVPDSLALAEALAWLETQPCGPER